MGRDRPPIPPGPYLVVGLARSGVAAALALAREGEVVACDATTPPEALAERERLERAGVEVQVDNDGTQLLARTPAPRTLVKSPGVPLDAAVVGEARRRGVEVVGELELGWRMLPNEFIAVTGTNGKTTTVELIGAMHRMAGAPVAVAGNIGTPLTALAGKIDPAATVVCEASSFQLEDSVAFAPEAAVFLNISEDHLDRHGSFDAYLDAKLRIFAHQDESDVAILGPGVKTPQPQARVVRAEELQSVIRTEDVRLQGPFNFENALCAAAVCRERGLELEDVRATLRQFGGLPHRLEPVATIDGVDYVNDSKATNPRAATAAMQAIGGGVHAILGGSLKGGEFRQMEGDVRAFCRTCYLIGEAADKLAEDLAESDVELVHCGELERAVHEAARRARPGEVVLLAPACASFDQFVDYSERGERFRELVQAEGEAK